jgi:beta-N-acetylhexosaminidase
MRAMKCSNVVAAALLIASICLLGASSLTARAESIGPDEVTSGTTSPGATQPAAPLEIPSPSQVPAADLRTMVGQMLMVGFLGTSTNGEWVGTVRAQLQNGALGGVFFLGRNVSSRAQVTALTRYFADAGGAQPPFIAIDQEGGFVQRLNRSTGFTLIPSAMRMAERHGRAAAGDIYAVAARELAAAGFNVNFSPVVDLNINPRNPIIGSVRRSYGADPSDVADYAGILIDAHDRAGVLTALKHFPGHGSSTADSHEVLVDITNTWTRQELQPYQTLIDRGYQGMVMVGHLYNGALDGGGRRPATFSSPVIDGVLRGTLNYDGVVITDDLEMGAIRTNYDLEATIINAIAAGNDILLFSQSDQARMDLPERVFAVVEAAIASGELDVDSIVQSYGRIVTLKARLAGG